MREKIAVVGTGVAGLGCAWHLRDLADLTLYEKQGRPGGHTNTVNVTEGNQLLPIDTGFIVFNKVTYPNLVKLFRDLDVKEKPSEMSFSVQHLPSALEYNGMGISKLFAQRRNLANPRFYSLLKQIFRFFQVAREELVSPTNTTVREFSKLHRLGPDFLDLYLVPMSSAVWSTDPDDILDFPVETLIRFFHNHGFLGITTHHPWFTVDGGARTYIKKILSEVGKPVLSSPATFVRETPDSAEVGFTDGTTRKFDRVILACHADESLRLLGEPTKIQQDILGAFRYQKNTATLHTWEGVMPCRRRAWASWNYRVEEEGSQGRATTHYWMNALQGISREKNYFVSLNSREAIPDSHICYETVYEHPVFTTAAVAAQSKIHSLNTASREQRLFFCGSYFKYGFHEDVYSSGLYLSALLRDRLAQSNA